MSAAGHLAGGAPRPGEAERATADRSSGPAPLQTTGGGSPFSSTAASFSLGGLAILLATLLLAGPVLRRRLPGRTVTAWPAAFVPLLERPG
jgi:hypothetical protein